MKIKKSVSNFFSFVKVYCLPYKPLSRSRQTWEQEFKDNKWDYLSDINQLSRYSIIIGYFNFWFEGGSILDLGCGQGLLLNRLNGINYELYVGVDLSEEAMKIAANIATNKAKFVCSEISSYEPDQRFDMIVFNESLYYFDKPIEVIKKYKNFLSKDGKIIISMWDNKERNNKLWKDVDRSFKVVDDLRLQKIQRKSSWVIKVIE
ncbi:MAG: class I SAM-dependent methyltransferase [Ignavibacteriales bacterium]|nr:class I SAM-dependent methyltransferase [Ignavibacteriales bacterium]